MSGQHLTGVIIPIGFEGFAVQGEEGGRDFIELAIPTTPTSDDAEQIAQSVALIAEEDEVVASLPIDATDVSQGEVVREEDERVDAFGRSVEKFEDIAQTAEDYRTRRIRDAMFSVDALRAQVKALREERIKIEVKRDDAKRRVVAAEAAENVASKKFETETAGFQAERNTFEDITGRLSAAIDAIHKQPDDHASVKPTSALFRQLRDDLDALLDGTYVLEQAAADDQSEPAVVSIDSVLTDKAEAFDRMNSAGNDLAFKQRKHQEEQAVFVEISLQAEEAMKQVDAEAIIIMKDVQHEEVVDAFRDSPTFFRGIKAATKTRIAQIRGKKAPDNDHIGLEMIPNRQELNQ